MFNDVAIAQMFGWGNIVGVYDKINYNISLLEIDL